MLRLFFIFGALSDSSGRVLFYAHFCLARTLHSFAHAVLTGKSEKCENSNTRKRCEAPPDHTQGGDILYQNNPYYPQMGQPQGYQRPTYIPQQQIYQQPMQQQAQDNMPQVRFVASREEAVASTVIPGMPCIMINRADGELYFKAIDIQSGVPIFEDYAKKRPEQMQAPQYATLDALNALRGEFEQMIDQRMSAIAAPRQAPRKAVNTNDE